MADSIEVHLVEPPPGDRTELSDIPIEPIGRNSALAAAEKPKYGALAQSDRFMPLDEATAARPRGVFARASSYLSGLPTTGKILAGSAALAVVLVIVIPIAVVLGRTSTSVTPMQDECSYAGYRLQGAFIPRNYDVTWGLQLQTAPYSFTGQTTIDIVAASASAGGIAQQCLQLHSHSSLTVSSASLNGAAIDMSQATVNLDDERVTLRLPQAVQPGQKISLSLTYNAVLRTDDTGLYLATYTNDQGILVPAATTQFEATYFRRASPSFDEPAYKATFAVTVKNAPAGYTTVSNMPVASSTADTVVFQRTPAMSTYLVAMVSSPMVKVTNANAGRWGNVSVSVYAPYRVENQYKIGYALVAACKALAFYETQFNVAYPLPKLDHIAVTSFAAGAMENWGAMIYRETSLLGNTTISSQAELQRIVVVVCHETAHSWFGDLVTMNWWSALFLNEGGARFFEYLCTDAVAPQFQIMRTFYSGVVLEAMKATSYATSRSLYNPQGAQSSQGIESQFDSVAYAFGGSILNMLKGFLDKSRPGAFFGGLEQYFKRLAYSNGAPMDLWNAFAATSNLPDLGAWASTYTSQVGYPLLTVAWKDPATMAGAGNGILTVSQSRAYLSSYSKQQTPADQASPQWWIPLTIAAEHPAPTGPVPVAIKAASDQGGFTSKVWQSTIGTAGNAYVVARDGWVKLSANATGYARTLYPTGLYTAFSAAITPYLQQGQVYNAPMSPADRGQLISDLFFHAYGGQFLTDSTGNGAISMATFLNFIKPFAPYEEAYEGVIPTVSALLQLRSILTPDGWTPSQPEACIDAANSFGAYTLRSLAAKLNFSAPAGTVGPESPLTISLRSTVISAASSFGVQAVIDQANAIYASAVNGPLGTAGLLQLDPNIVTPIMASACRWSPDSSVYNALRQLYIATTDAAQKRRFISAMAATRDPALLQSLLADSLDTSVVKPMDTVSVIVSVASNAVGRSLAWAFVQQNWAELNKRYGSGGFSLSSLVSGSVSGLTDANSLDSVTAFFKLNPVPGAVIEIAQGIETISSNINFSAAQRDATCTWLRQQR